MNSTLISGRELFEQMRGGPYALLKHFEPGLVLDIGAASGAITKKLHEYSPHSQIYAFEPFPGNWPHFERFTSHLENIQLFKNAVSDTAESVNFYVPKTVIGNEPGWENMVGYSSGGHIVASKVDDDPRFMTVEAVRLDDLVSGDVLLAKIDVQGGELRVLQGGSSLLNNGKIKMIYMEFDGNLELLKLLDRNDFLLLDNEYLVSPRNSVADLSEWEITRTIPLSSGVPAYRAWPIEYPRRLENYAEFLAHKREGIRVVQTDLFCIHKSFLGTVLGALSAAFQVHKKIDLV